TLHLNEQWPEYWAKIFSEHGYETVDCLRRELWSNEQLEWWYAQNAFLFIERQHLASHPSLVRLQAVSGPGQLSVVHPRNYLEKAHRANIGLAEALEMIPALVKAAFLRR